MVDARYGGQLGVFRSSNDLCKFESLDLISKADFQMGKRAFRMSMFRKGIREARARVLLKDLYERAPPFPKKKFTPAKQEKLDKLCRKGSKALIPPEYHYFYDKDFVAP